LAARAAERQKWLDARLIEADSLVSGQQFNRAIILLCDLSREYRGESRIAQLLERACEQRTKWERIIETASEADQLSAGGQFEAALNLLNDALTAYPGESVLIECQHRASDRQREMQALAQTERALEEAQWLLDQGRPDLAAQFLGQKAATLTE